MMKPGIGTYDRFKQMFDQYSRKPARNNISFLILSPRIQARPIMTCSIWRYG